MNFETFWSKIGSPWGYLFNIAYMSVILNMDIFILISERHKYVDGHGVGLFLFVFLHFLMIVLFFVMIGISFIFGLALLKYWIDR